MALWLCVLKLQSLLLAVLAAPIVSWVYAMAWGHHARVWWWVFEDWQTLGYSVLLYPVIEELTFRGVVQGTLLRKSFFVYRYAMLSRANLLTSILFAAIHLVHNTPLWAGLIFFPSLIFGWFRDQTGGVTTSVGLHMFYNLIFLMITGK